MYVYAESCIIKKKIFIADVFNKIFYTISLINAEEAYTYRYDTVITYK